MDQLKKASTLLIQNILLGSPLDLRGVTVLMANTLSFTRPLHEIKIDFPVMSGPLRLKFPVKNVHIVFSLIGFSTLGNVEANQILHGSS